MKCFGLMVACGAGMSLLAVGCGHANTLTALQQSYDSAVKDAAVASAAEVAKLHPLKGKDDLRVWSEDGTRVLVVTWVDDTTVAGKRWNGKAVVDVGPPWVAGMTPLAEEDPRWVTVVPELQKFCAALGQRGVALDLRLTQLLGLPLGTRKTRMVELWVSPKDMLRPCPDPEIDDERCEVSEVARPVAGWPEYPKWFVSNRSQSYGARGYPWTRLGYTYDWGGDGRPVGVNEYLIRPGAAFEVNAVVGTDDYCRKR